jgi:cytochrome c oxidase assembly protein subunit 15
MIGVRAELASAAPSASAPWVTSKPVAVWLFAVATAVVAMVVVGGATRLTGSGLSITEWKPVSGALPPLTSAAWADAFDKYRHSSQYALINRGISLADFKSLFWWEWAHRLLGRVLGFLFAAPFLGFLVTRQLPRRWLGRCVLLFALGALQGAVGWWMVESGLEGRASVAPERLATHLGLALVLFSSLVWCGLDAWFGEARGRRTDGWRLATAAFAAGVFLQCLMGALVAGNHAGLVDGDWPLMAGRIVPEDYWQGGLWATVAHGLSAAQFDHRVMAYALILATFALSWGAWRSPTPLPALRGLTAVAGLIVLMQAGLGIAALWNGVPLVLALLHQLDAVVMLGVAVGIAWRGSRT